MNRVIPENLKNLRAERKLSLGEAAELTGVSKSMLGQIERGESSPTIATLWKIATGLGVSFTALLESPDQEIEIVKETDMTPLLSDYGGPSRSWIWSWTRTRSPIPSPTPRAPRSLPSSTKGPWRSCWAARKRRATWWKRTA